MSGEVNMIPTHKLFKGGPVQANFGGASLETFSGEAQLKKTPCILIYPILIPPPPSPLKPPPLPLPDILLPLTSALKVQNIIGSALKLYTQRLKKTPCKYKSND